MRLHCCQGLGEVAMVEQLRGASPLGWLQQLGLLSPRSLLPHGIYTQGDDDLQRLVDGGASLVHCPVVFARDGEALNSFGRYRAKGINFALGTDTWPADLLDNMRQGLNIARLMEGGNSQTSTLDMYNAATSAAPRRWAVTISVAWRRGPRPTSPYSACAACTWGRCSTR